MLEQVIPLARRRQQYATTLINFATVMLEHIATVPVPAGCDPLQMRIGIHVGRVVAGVIGSTKFAYDLWGESVNLASRLESSGAPGRIHVSDAFRIGLQDTMNFEEHGEITLKGVGLTRTHWLIAPKDH